MRNDRAQGCRIPFASHLRHGDPRPDTKPEGHAMSLSEKTTVITG
jgi:hypothetical protein